MACLSSFLYAWWFVHLAVPSYFCAACHVLGETLSALGGKLEACPEEDLQELCGAYRDVTAALARVNEALHALVLSAFASILTTTFRFSYTLIFSPRSEDNAVLGTVNILNVFSWFVVMCLSASTVTDADAGVQSAVQKWLLKKHRRPDSERFLSAAREPFRGFRLLDSIVVDSGLVMSADGCLFTYGMLVATFNVSA